MRTRQEIKAQARERLRPQFVPAILIVLVYTIVAAILGYMSYEELWFVSIAGSVLSSVLIVNYLGEFLKVHRGETAGVGGMFSAFGVNFLRKLGGMLWMMLWVVIWSLLLVVPGVVTALASSMAPSILAVHPNVTARQALTLSKKITKGHKGKIFVFFLSFIGWFLLAGLPYIALSIAGVDTIIISVNSYFEPAIDYNWAAIIPASLISGAFAVAFVYPYFYTAFSGLFLQLRNNALREGAVTPDELGTPEPGSI
jgi:uncharacterized membrane protein